jgi:serine/threonine-protein kinase
LITFIKYYKALAITYKIKPDFFSVVTTISCDSMGVVYLGHDRILARDVALKQLPNQFDKDKDTIERFKQEAVALARLSHPHIVQVYDFVQEDDQAWIASHGTGGGPRFG